MRSLLAVLALTAPAHAWEFTPLPVCTLTHDTGSALAKVTHDPRQPEPYTIALTRAAEPWPAGAMFGIAFDGPRPLTITTNRHRLSDGGRTISVSDVGFGNVLNGLAFNDTATAFIAGDDTVFPLEGASGPVAEFLECTTTAPMA